MAIRFPTSLIIVDGLWTGFKAQVAVRGLSCVVQYDDDGTSYTIWAVEGDLCFTCQIYKGMAPNSNYTQGQNDLDKAAFLETEGI